MESKNRNVVDKNSMRETTKRVRDPEDVRGKENLFLPEVGLRALPPPLRTGNTEYRFLAGKSGSVPSPLAVRTMWIDKRIHGITGWVVIESGPLGLDGRGTNSRVESWNCHRTSGLELPTQAVTGGKEHGRRGGEDEDCKGQGIEEDARITF
ncbi:hypothetical protein AAG570_011211 [Ranatra chinensis]|uniref:Uncharacterized protein n=1 Tax=Ranatra chinensis TaxID=642074 RepID=A0ABD0YK36_9HEMI